jgi:alpha-ketoglutarate-dependent 2,4-dichlorophenoxyacetate dioxygenase
MVTFCPLHPLFVAEVGAIDLRATHDQDTLDELREGMDRYGVLVFRDQSFTDAEQLDFGRRFDGELLAKRGIRSGGPLIGISNLDEDGEIMASDDRRRMYSLANRLWHTDASFENPRGRYSMLHAREVPPVPADTQFADQRAAYDALDDEMRSRIEGLSAHHSIAYSRQTLGFDFTAEELERLAGVEQPLVHTIPGSGRRSLYLASHASRIVGWPLPEGRLLLRDLLEHATAPERTYTHQWRVGDLVVWDNRATLHRGLPYDDTRYRRDMRRVTTLDLPRVPVGSSQTVAGGVDQAETQS